MEFKSKAGQLSIAIDQICKSYFKNDDAIISFSHSRIFEDGSRAELWSNGMAMEHTYLESGLTIKTHAPDLYKPKEKFIFLKDKIQSRYAMTNFGLAGYCMATGILTVLNVIYLLPVAGILADMFPTKYRYTGVSLSINIVSSLFGGTAPLLLALLVSYSGSFFASGAYLFFTATIGYLTASWKSQNTKERGIYVS